MAEGWEFQTDTEMLGLLFGDGAGETRDEKIENTRREKRWIGEALVEFLKLKETDTVLEIGSGCGFTPPAVAPHVKQLYCCDVSQSFLEMARQECAGIENIQFFKVASGSLDFLEDGSLDAAYSYNVFIHLNIMDIYLYFRELQRVLKPGGRVWFDIRLAEFFDDEHMPFFEQMVAEYEDNRSSLVGLIQYNSLDMILKMAERNGLELADEQLYEESFCFVKT